MKMINKEWFELEKFETLAEVSEEDVQQLTIRLNNRIFDLIVNEYEDNTIMDIFLLENDIHLCSFYSSLSNSENIPVEKIKSIFTKWLVEKTDVKTLQTEFNEIETLAIYEYYLQGEKGLIEYKWKNLESRLNQDYRQQNRGSEILNLYKKSEKLEGFKPYISLSRLCLGTEDATGYIKSDFCCFYYDTDVEKYVVSNYENTEKHFFANAKAAITFAEKQAMA